MQRHNVDRRRFLHAAAAATAGLAAGPSLLPAEDTDNSPPAYEKKAVKIGMVRAGKTLKDKFLLLKKLGFGGVELNSPNGPKPEEVAEAKEASGLEVHGVVDSVHWAEPLSSADPLVRAKGRRGLEAAIRAASEYGASSVLLVPGVVKDGVTYKQAWDRSLNEIRPVLELAEERKIQILMENVWNNFITDPKEMARYIDALESDLVGAYFDVGNAVRYSPPVEWVRILGERIKKLDIKEYSLTKGKAEGWFKGFQVELLEGECDWPAVMKEVRKLKSFSGWGTAEIPGGGEERLTNIAHRMDRIFAS